MRYWVTAITSAACVFALATAPARAQAPDLAVLADQDAPQQAAQQAPAHLELVDGAVTIEHQGQSNRAAMSQPLLAGDRVRTERGRVEVVFADGSFLYLDEFTALEFLSDSLMRLTQGRATLIVKGQSDSSSAAAARYQIDTPAASVRTDVAGEYRIALLNGRASAETELAVVRGAAQIATDAGAMMVRAGERTTAVENGAPSMPYAFNSARFDAFDQWIAARQDSWVGSTSTRYLPQDVQMYAGTFDRYGTWGSDPQYGSVWYPTVAPTWRPYYNGYWDYYPGSYGWFWIGADPWGWPTHHWGRWGFARSRWFWIPHRRWASAWVSWAISPTYVSWCPLGWDGRPVVGFYGARSVYGYDPWHAWTIIPRHSLGRRIHVSNYWVDGRRLASTARTGFIVQRTGPQGPPQSRVVAVPRGSTPTQAVPRAGTFGSPSSNRRFDRPAVDPRAGAGGQRAPAFVNRRGAVVAGSVPPDQPTRIDPPRYAPGYGYAVPRQSEESPYDRAARVAGERAPGRGRQPLGQGDTSYESPYPPQYRSTVPEPFRPNRRDNSPGYVPMMPMERAVPRGSRAPQSDPMIVAPPPGARSYPAPYSPTVVQPRRGGGPDGGPPPEARAPRGGGERAQPRQQAQPRGDAQPRGGGQPQGGGQPPGGNRRRGGG